MCGVGKADLASLLSSGSGGQTDGSKLGFNPASPSAWSLMSKEIAVSIGRGRHKPMLGVFPEVVIISGWGTMTPIHYYHYKDLVMGAHTLNFGPHVKVSTHVYLL